MNIFGIRIRMKTYVDPKHCFPYSALPPPPTSSIIVLNVLNLDPDPGGHRIWIQNESGSEILILSNKYHNYDHFLPRLDFFKL